MQSHRIQPSDKAGYIQVTDIKTGLFETVFMGELATRLQSANMVEAQSEPPAQKWVALIAA
ncbi:hypothetical protein [Devosia sp.]|uniref:hypothetical protein n=1 Tax=Devosia sp. TaxID=1871048 RepID=UPI00326478B1